MKKKLLPRTSRRHRRDEIIKKAKEGAFDRNPLLATPHDLVCKACGCTHRKTYLDYLKSGRFELGKTETVEVARSAPTISGLSRTAERITPIIIRVACKRCGADTAYSPISLEYLLFTVRKQWAPEHMYI